VKRFALGSNAPVVSSTPWGEHRRRLCDRSGFAAI
jgi:hypothetical protein